MCIFFEQGRWRTHASAGGGGGCAKTNTNTQKSATIPVDLVRLSRHLHKSLAGFRARPAWGRNKKAYKYLSRAYPISTGGVSHGVVYSRYRFIPTVESNTAVQNSLLLLAFGTALPHAHNKKHTRNEARSKKKKTPVFLIKY